MAQCIICFLLPDSRSFVQECKTMKMMYITQFIKILSLIDSPTPIDKLVSAISVPNKVAKKMPIAKCKPGFISTPGRGNKGLLVPTGRGAKGLLAPPGCADKGISENVCYKLTNWMTEWPEKKLFKRINKSEIFQEAFWILFCESLQKMFIESNDEIPSANAVSNFRCSGKFCSGRTAPQRKCTPPLLSPLLPVVALSARCLCTAASV